MSQPLLSIRDLNIHFGKNHSVNNLSFDLKHGERLALVGESGSGKTVTALSILKLVKQARIQGKILLEGKDIVAAKEQELRSIRGRDVAIIFQEPMTAMNPLFTIGNQIIETLRLHNEISHVEARKQAIAILTRTGIRDPEQRIDSYPHQLSGGQRQRAMIAMALACRPKLLIADEPTTALDWTIRSRIIKLLLDLQEEFGMAVLLITHDLNLVRHFAERVVVMNNGQVVETATTENIFAAPQHPYTVKLINSLPTRNVQPVPTDSPVLLAAKNLRVTFPKSLSGFKGWFKSGEFVAVKDASLELRKGETVGIVGESGSGKSTLAQAILNLIPAHSGQILLNGQSSHRLNKKQQLRFRSKVQVVFQDPFGSLSPRKTIGYTVGEGLHLHFPELDKAQYDERIAQVLHDVGLPTSILNRYPHEFSGGQRQRIAIARALILQPEILILDEPTSALDVSIQNQVLELLLRLQQRYRLSYLLISHDLTVINALSHRLYVMKDGDIVEHGEASEVIRHPSHPYTKQLIQATL
jgi:microcin C transport system ATP-binding protein